MKTRSRLPRSWSHRLWVAALICLLPVVAAADDSPRGFVVSKHNQLMSLLSKPKSAQNDAAIAKVVDATLDYDALAREALHEACGVEPNSARGTEFKQVLTQIVRRAYRDNLRKIVDYRVTFGGAKQPLPRAYRHVVSPQRVASTAKHRSKAREPAVRIDYVLHKGGGGMRVVDVITDGSSLAGTYHNQFGTVCRKHGFDGLMKRLKRKL
jgi:phospholipid transport system substrate-binding protein